ncbi:MAG: Spy0128 family protein [Gemmiger formicilis]|uniref:Spy0128 family protein n=1 Tax=Gemmiger formicilis TaxID=745368 RepID=UPI0039938A23
MSFGKRPCGAGCPRRRWRWRCSARCRSLRHRRGRDPGDGAHRRRSLRHGVHGEDHPLDNAPAPAQTSVQVKGGGTAYFTGLTFDAPGDYRYKLAQVKGRAADTTYDGRTYTVTVRVMTAADGGLDAELWAVRSGRTAKAAGVVFTNRYDPPAPAATAAPAPSAAPMPRPAKNTARPVGALPRTGDAFPLEALAALLCAGVVGFGTAWNKRR